MLKESASMEMTRLAKEYARQGYKVFALSAGDAHFNLPDTIQSRMLHAMREGKTHYVDAIGIPELRASISEIEFKGAYRSDEIIVVPGVKQGLFYFIKSIRGKRVCILEPAWLGYHSICHMCDKEIIRINLKQADWLERLRAAEFDALLLCTPNNPDGRIFSKAEMEWIYSIINEKEAMLLIDEIYSLYSYETDIKEILQPYYAKKNVVVFTGFSKGYAATGLRLGCVACHDQALIKRMNIIHQNSATCANTLAQYAFVDYGDVLSEAKYFSEYYLGNRDMVCEIIPEFNQFKPSGGFYYFINLEKFGITDGDVFAKELLEKTKVAVVPGSAYGEGFNSWIRISYSIDKLLLAEGLQILKKYISNHG